MKVFEANEKILLYLQEHRILAAYKKAKTLIQNDYYQEVQLKKRQPKSKNIYQFRITRKYRAFAIKKNNTLIIFHISDHQ
jgi:hypothetical protein